MGKYRVTIVYRHERHAASPEEARDVVQALVRGGLKPVEISVAQAVTSAQPPLDATNEVYRSWRGLLDGGWLRDLRLSQDPQGPHLMLAELARFTGIDRERLGEMECAGHTPASDDEAAAIYRALYLRDAEAQLAAAKVPSR